MSLVVDLDRRYDWSVRRDTSSPLHPFHFAVLQATSSLPMALCHGNITDRKLRTCSPAWPAVMERVKQLPPSIVACSFGQLAHLPL